MVFLTLVVLISAGLLLWINSFTSVVVEANREAKIKSILLVFCIGDDRNMWFFS